MLGWVLVCTLLGPEGPGLLLLFGVGGGSDSWAFVARLCVEWGWYRSYVENYTVDASIFVMLKDFFDKLLSAIGGCLGTKSR